MTKAPLRVPYARIQRAPLTLVAASFMVALIPRACYCDAPRADVVKEAQAAWAERSEAVVAADFRLKERATFHAGRWTEPGPGRHATQPPEDVTFERTVRCAFDGAKLRYDSDGFIWSNSVGKLVPRQNVTTFNANAKTRVNYYPLNEDGLSDAQIEPSGRSHCGRNVDILPIMLAFRSFDHDTCPLLGWDSAVVLPDKVAVEGHECVILEFGLVESKGKASLYVDPAQQFVVRRYIAGTRSQSGEFITHVRADIDYTVDATTRISVPASWRASWRPSGAGDSFDVHVESAVLNPEIPAAEFDIPAFKPGTMIYDFRERSGGAPKTSIIKMDGRERPIPPDDYHRLSRDELLNTEPATETLARVSPTRAVLIAINGVVVVGLLGWIVVRRAGRRLAG